MNMVKAEKWAALYTKEIEGKARHDIKHIKITERNKQQNERTTNAYTA